MLLVDKIQPPIDVKNSLKALVESYNRFKKRKIILFSIVQRRQKQVLSFYDEKESPTHSIPYLPI